MDRLIYHSQFPNNPTIPILQAFKGFVGCD